MLPDSAALWSLFGVPLLIFAARVADVSLGTLRIALVARGVTRAAPWIGFFESLIWVIAISQVVRHLDRPWHYLAWAAGYAVGTWVGGKLDERLAFGMIAVRVITEDDAETLLARLREHAFGVTSFGARGLTGRVRLIFSVIRRRDLDRFLDAVRSEHPKAFVSISDVRTASEGYFATPPSPGRSLRELLKRK
jgi:uncharacterized protein YebE (UPF0316 family)